MSSGKTNCSRSNSALTKHDAHVISQTSIDAKLHVDFEESNKLFDYSTSVDFNVSSSTSNVPSSTVSAYLQNMQRGRLIQSFGCVIAVDEQSFTVIAYNENAPEMLDIAPHDVPSIEQQEALTIGTGVRTLFRPSGVAALKKAANFGQEVPQDNEFEKRIRPEVIPANEISVTFADVGALDEIKESLQELVMLPLNRPDLFSGGLLKPCRGILRLGLLEREKQRWLKPLQKRLERASLTYQCPQLLLNGLAKMRRTLELYSHLQPRFRQLLFLWMRLIACLGSGPGLGNTKP